jgi:hypothetical protein
MFKQGVLRGSTDKNASHITDSRSYMSTPASVTVCVAAISPTDTPSQVLQQ